MAKAQRKPTGSSMETSKKKPTLVREDAPAAAPEAEQSAPAAATPADAPPPVAPGLPASAPQLQAAPPRMARAPMEYSQSIEQMLKGEAQPKNPATPTLLARIKDISIDMANTNQQIAKQQQQLSDGQQLLNQMLAQREHLNGALRSQGETIWHLENAAPDA